MSPKSRGRASWVSELTLLQRLFYFLVPAREWSVAIRALVFCWQLQILSQTSSCSNLASIRGEKGICDAALALCIFYLREVEALIHLVAQILR